MARRGGLEKPKASKNGIVYTRDFEVVEMNELNLEGSRSQFTTTSYAVATPHIGDASRPDSLWYRSVQSFKRADAVPLPPGPYSFDMNGGLPRPAQVGGRSYDLRAANVRVANSALSRDLKGRHLQMIAISGSVGTGLFVTSGFALFLSGPLSLLLAYVVVGMFQFCVMQSLGELVVTFPVAGAFSALSTRFLDPSWGFAMGWNYALKWLFVLPLEIIAGALTIRYWNQDISKTVFITIFLIAIVALNLCGIKGFGEAEFLFSVVKVTAIVGFILLGIVINIGGSPDGGYIGGQYWRVPGSTTNGFKAFCSVLIAASASFSGTELIGLAAAETANPRKSLPSAIKQVFWKIAMFYIVALLLVGLLVPHDEPRLIGAGTLGAAASPFVIAVESAGSTILPSVMNAVILVSVLSVGNSAVFGSSRTLASLAEQSHAPEIFSYVDRKGRPLVAILFAGALGLFAYLADVKFRDEIFDWLFAICGLSTLFTWSSICLCHIQFRRAWAAAGNSLDQLPFRSQVGVIGSWAGILGNVLVLAAHVWLTFSPVGGFKKTFTQLEVAKSVVLQTMAVPIVFIFYVGHKLWFRTRVVRIHDMDIDTGRSFTRLYDIRADQMELSMKWPRWKRLYRSFC